MVSNSNDQMMTVSIKKIINKPKTSTHDRANYNDLLVPFVQLSLTNYQSKGFYKY